MWGAQYRALQLDITPPPTAGQLFDEEMGRKRQFKKEAESKAFRFKELNTTFAEELAQLRTELGNNYIHSVYKDIEAHTKRMREVEANILEDEQLVERIRHLMNLEYRIFYRILLHFKGSAIKSDEGPHATGQMFVDGSPAKVAFYSGSKMKKERDGVMKQTKKATTRLSNDITFDPPGDVTFEWKSKSLRTAESVDTFSTKRLSVEGIEEGLEDYSSAIVHREFPIETTNARFGVFQTPKEGFRILRCVMNHTSYESDLKEVKELKDTVVGDVTIKEVKVTPCYVIQQRIVDYRNKQRRWHRHLGPVFYVFYTYEQTFHVKVKPNDVEGGLQALEYVFKLTRNEENEKTFNPCFGCKEEWQLKREIDKYSSLRTKKIQNGTFDVAMMTKQYEDNIVRVFDDFPSVPMRGDRTKLQIQIIQ